MVMHERIGSPLTILPGLNSVLRIENALHLGEHVGERPVLLPDVGGAAQAVGMFAADRAAHVEHFAVQIDRQRAILATSAGSARSRNGRM